jgi:hypothetical protein
MAITWWPGLSLGLVEALKEKPKPAPQLVQPKVEDQPLTPPTGKVKSLEEMMREAKQKAAGGGTSDAAPAPTEPPRVKSLEELMREAKAKKAAEVEPEAEAAPDAGE